MTKPKKPKAPRSVGRPKLTLSFRTLLKVRTVLYRAAAACKELEDAEQFKGKPARSFMRSLHSEYATYIHQRQNHISPKDRIAILDKELEHLHKAQEHLTALGVEAWWHPPTNTTETPNTDRLRDLKQRAKESQSRLHAGADDDEDEAELLDLALGEVYQRQLLAYESTLGKAVRARFHEAVARYAAARKMLQQIAEECSRHETELKELRRLAAPGKGSGEPISQYEKEFFKKMGVLWWEHFGDPPAATKKNSVTKSTPPFEQVMKLVLNVPVEKDINARLEDAARAARLAALEQFRTALEILDEAQTHTTKQRI